MRLGLRKSFDRAPPAPAANVISSQPSIALERLLNHLEAAPRRVLDLGPPISDNLALYQRLGARITVADFYRFFVPRRPEGLDGAEARGRLFDDLLPHGETTRFDAIFAWDLLDYLSPDENSWLLQNLGDLCNRGARLLVLTSGQRQLPMSPPNYVVEDSRTLRCESGPPADRPFPAYSEQALLRFMPGLEVDSRLQLRNQMVEYLLRYG